MDCYFFLCSRELCDLSRLEQLMNEFCDNLKHVFLKLKIHVCAIFLCGVSNILQKVSKVYVIKEVCCTATMSYILQVRQYYHLPNFSILLVKIIGVGIDLEISLFTPCV